MSLNKFLLLYNSKNSNWGDVYIALFSELLVTFTPVSPLNNYCFHSQTSHLVKNTGHKSFFIQKKKKKESFLPFL